jgi:type IV pilus assembly protein PilV
MTKRMDRGFTLLEAMIAMVVMLVGLLGLAGLQVVGVRSNHFSKRMAQASALALDLSEQMNTWAMNDPRLASLGLVSTPTDPLILSTDLGRAATTAVNPEYSDQPGDTNSIKFGIEPAGGWLRKSGYQGIQSDVLNNGSPDFVRYWNVYNYGSSQVLLVQIMVRWLEPGLGYREIVTSTLKVDPSTYASIL